MLDPELVQLAEELRSIIAANPPDLALQVDARIARIVPKQDPSSIGLLLPLLSDSASSDDGMFSIVHACEAFSDDVYVSAVVPMLPRLSSSAPRWSSIVFMRMLNNPETRHHVVRHLRIGARESRDAVRALCLAINAQHPEFREKTAAVLVATETT